MTKRFVYATRGHVPDYVVDPSGQTPAVYRILTDQLGSPRVVVEAATGEVVERIAYDELGAATHESGLTEASSSLLPLTLPRGPRGEGEKRRFAPASWAANRGSRT